VAEVIIVWAGPNSGGFGFPRNAVGVGFRSLGRTPPYN